MPSTCIGRSLRSVLLLCAPIFHAVLADLHNVPLSPAELQFEMNSVGGDNINVDQVYKLAEEPTPANMHQHQKRYGSGEPYWYELIKRQGKVIYGADPSRVIFRNVKDFGATGDGVTDDTAALQAASAFGGVCGDVNMTCTSSSTQPSIVYFPPGIYQISRPVIMYYNSAFIGNHNNLPILRATRDFAGIGLLDSNPYIQYNDQYYQNQNNMWRQVKNFVFDLRDAPPTNVVHGIHWQIAQATSLQNLVFEMVPATTGDGNQQIGIFMDNGSGLFFEDCIFNGGRYGLFAGNQQVNVRNLTFNGCATGLFQNWGWIFSYKSLVFNDCSIGIDMSQGGINPAVHSIVVADSEFNNCDYGVVVSFDYNTTPYTAGSLVLDNVDFTTVSGPAVMYPNLTSIIPGGQVIATYVQGTRYSVSDQIGLRNGRQCYGPTATQQRIQETVAPFVKPPVLLDEDGKFVERRRPLYEGVPVENFISILDYGCIGDGVTDDTDCVQNFFDSIAVDTQIAYVDHAAYVITSTVTIPNNIKIVGEFWPMFMVTGLLFQDQFNPVAAFRVGQPGDIGTTEISEILFETIGPTPGAIMVEWNLAAPTPAAAGLWDTHWRIGGSNGTQLDYSTCPKAPDQVHGADPACWCTFLVLHVTASARNILFSNLWQWISDHDLDLLPNQQIDIYNGRGFLIESQGPMWVYGSSSEHSMLYNYQLSGARNIYMGMIQSETA